ncbi:MAG: HYR domain-containing protein [Actinobacteria bacterium]|nr:MAG: HYR domain-containing protein [Actinomycetota bacterium]
MAQVASTASHLCPSMQRKRSWLPPGRVATPAPRAGARLLTCHTDRPVPGLDFDLTPPVLTAPGRKTVLAPRRLKRVRVTYVVTAQDDADGALPVTCRPSSGSWFSIGRTRVRCSATDTSGNESAIIFVVAVKRQGRERRSLQAHEKRAASAALLR